MLGCMQRRRVLFYLFLALDARSPEATTAFLVRAAEQVARGSVVDVDIATILAMRTRAGVLDAIDTLMGMLEIEQGLAGRDRGIVQCAATRFMRRQGEMA